MYRTEIDSSNNSSTVACVFVAAVTFLQSRCLATIGEYTYRHTDRWKVFMKYSVEIGSGAMIYIGTKFHKDWFSHSELIKGDTQDSMVISSAYFYFSKIIKVS
jgi:hypothetical protein